jgi:hypothetical protein
MIGQFDKFWLPLLTITILFNNLRSRKIVFLVQSNQGLILLIINNYSDFLIYIVSLSTQTKNKNPMKNKIKAIK